MTMMFISVFAAARMMLLFYVVVVFASEVIMFEYGFDAARMVILLYVVVLFSSELHTEWGFDAAIFSFVFLLWIIMLLRMLLVTEHVSFLVSTMGSSIHEELVNLFRNYAVIFGRASLTKQTMYLFKDMDELRDVIDSRCDTIPVKVYTRKKNRVNETGLTEFNSIFGYWLDPLGQSCSWKMEWWGAVYKPISRSSYLVTTK
ncbi:hypothetical protein Tco_0290828 [Tanacetum coccineum]